MTLLPSPTIYRGARRHSLQGWLELGGKRYYMKSIWERNIARYLE
jgi:hypothetical protein